MQTVLGTRYMDPVTQRVPLCGTGCGAAGQRSCRVESRANEPIRLDVDTNEDGDCLDSGGSTFYYYHQDANYNVIALTDSSGDVVHRYLYDAYGRPHTYTVNSDGVSTAEILLPGLDADGDGDVDVYNPFLFNGQPYDTETGFYYYRTRYLDPRTGRFTTRDSIGIWGDPINAGNGYAYVGGNPLRWVDPYGSWTWQDPWDITKGIGGGIYDLGAGIVGGTCQLVAHPIDTINGIEDTAVNTYVLFANDGNSDIEAIGNTLAAGVVSLLGGGGLLNGADAYGRGDLGGAARGITSGVGQAGLIALAVTKGGAAGSCRKGGAGPSGRVGITDKIAKQMGPRGWTEQQLAEAMRSGQQIPAINKATGNVAVRYVHPQTGQSVVVDTVTNEVIHVGGPGFKYGPACGDLP